MTSYTLLDASHTFCCVGGHHSPLLQPLITLVLTSFHTQLPSQSSTPQSLSRPPRRTYASNIAPDATHTLQRTSPRDSPPPFPHSMGNILASPVSAIRHSHSRPQPHAKNTHKNSLPTHPKPPTHSLTRLHHLLCDIQRRIFDLFTRTYLDATRRDTRKNISYVFFRQIFVDSRAHTHTRARSRLINAHPTLKSTLHRKISTVIRSHPPRSTTYPNYTRTVLRTQLGAISTKLNHLGVCETAIDLVRLLEHSYAAPGAVREIAISPNAGIRTL